ncbi:MAG: prolyl oligopeptidase family serine peptidase [Phycisphaerales bacterium]
MSTPPPPDSPRSSSPERSPEPSPAPPEPAADGAAGSTANVADAGHGTVASPAASPAAGTVAGPVTGPVAGTVAGTWPSPISPELAAAGAVIAGDLRADRDSLYWVEMRPESGGSGVVVQQRGDDPPADLTPPTCNVRSRVHEYGGGALAVDDGRVAFVRDPDGTVWLTDEDGTTPIPLTGPADGRFADPSFDPVRSRLLAVRERPRTAGDGPPSRGRQMIRSIAEIRFGRGDAAVAGGAAEAEADAEVDANAVHQRPSSAVRDLIVGPDFLAAPRIAAHGRELAWTSWNHPDMPWDASTLHRAELTGSGDLTAEGPQRIVAGGPDSREMVTDPQWTPGGDLLFVSDRDGQWGVYRDAPHAPGGVEVILRPGTDPGWLPWKFGIGHYAIAPPAGLLAGVRGSAGRPPTRLVVMPGRQGRLGRPAVIDATWARVTTLAAARYDRHLPGFGVEARPDRDEADPNAAGPPDALAVPTAPYTPTALAAPTVPYTPTAPPAPATPATPRHLPPVDIDAMIEAHGEAPPAPVTGALATDPRRPTAVLRIDPVAPGSVRVVREMPGARVDPAYLPAPEAISFPVDGAAHAGDHAHAWFYPPAHPDHTIGPDDPPPPLLLRAHGGPTGAARLEYDLEIRYWTSRGWAFCDVDYGGSAGYGRAYRERLRHRWGEVDVADCAAAAHHLAATGRVDGHRMAIAGGSAGGFTVLHALAQTDLFRAGINRFGVADLESFVGETHDFEAMYMDGLIGPWPEAADTYRARSPIHRAADINAPLLVLQGEEDRVVPPAQSRRIIAALEARGVPVESVFFPGEQHGFRRQSSLVTSIECMDDFLRRHVLNSPSS